MTLVTMTEWTDRPVQDLLTIAQNKLKSRASSAIYVVPPMSRTSQGTNK